MSTQLFPPRGSRSIRFVIGRQLARSSESGFTLLEMLVVMAIIAMMAGIALPNLSRFVESYENSTKWATLTAELDSLSYRAYASSRALSLNNETAAQLLPALPPGWKVNVGKSVRYRENGWCEGGELRITAANGDSRQFNLKSPQCAIGNP